MAANVASNSGTSTRWPRPSRSRATSAMATLMAPRNAAKCELIGIDVYDLRAIVGEQHRRQRPGNVLPEVDHAHAGERPGHHFLPSCLANCLAPLPNQRTPAYAARGASCAHPRKAKRPEHLTTSST